MSDKSLEEPRLVGSILRHSPNGVVLVDGDGRIRYVNPAFRKMFATGDGELNGRPVGQIAGSDCFDKAIASGGELSVRGSLAGRDLHYRACLFKIEGEGLYCGIFVDTSEEERARRQLTEMKAQTLARAHEVIRRQMQAAQEIAGLLGETTAETKTLLVKLMSLFREEGSR